MFDFESYWNYFDMAATIIGVISVVIAAWSSWTLRKKTEERWQKENQQIRVILRSLTREIRLPVEIKRGDFTRSELLGLIGMLSTENNQRFALGLFSTHEFSRQLEGIRESGLEFVIRCSEVELDQFKHEKQSIASAYPTS